ncbi:amidohydrolase family protein [Roseiconus nitratireducens]|uniref:Amidohydrolase family protein n=1 Tax=Roseiconus nitratireducens TaxID=2605748 RepID=A0A5M6CU08_9BACT|nr:amidohydrolase family protein [Roseiconus nitratireducens]KAA5538714.1 amidohydrolase family protein [Roseiconus nitratireducens]
MLNFICTNLIPLLGVLVLVSPLTVFAQESSDNESPILFHDSHFHLTNYVQEGPDIRDFLQIMGDEVGRSMVCGIPLQQQWMHASTGDFAPTYYTQTDAPLYYYSFTDAIIAHAYLRLTPEERDRFDPMITGFNPTDMYAADHIRRVLATFPGVFSGIGEFSIHKEFVSSKIAGEVATVENKALDRILDFAAEVGLPVVLHCDVDTPFPKPNQDPYIVTKLRELARRHRDTVIIWAHLGLGRVVRPVEDQLGMVERGFRDPESKNVHFDISWDEAAKYLVGSPEAIEKSAAIINRFPERFLFGTDCVAPKTRDDYLQVYKLYAPLFAKLTPEAKQMLLRGNYERIFDEARRRVRQWEAGNLNKNPYVISK